MEWLKDIVVPAAVTAATLFGAVRWVVTPRLERLIDDRIERQAEPMRKEIKEIARVASSATTQVANELPQLRRSLETVGDALYRIGERQTTHGEEIAGMQSALNILLERRLQQREPNPKRRRSDR